MVSAFLSKTKSLVLSIGLLIHSGAVLAADPITLPPGADFSILPPPPADDSPAGLADLNVLLYVQANRTPEQVEHAKSMASPSIFAMGRSIFGDWFTRENLPRTAEILTQVTKVTDPVKENAKKKWKRPRPYTRSNLISPVVGKPGDSGSYPSGHVYGTAVPLFVFTAAFPDHADDFEKIIRGMMWGRMVGGVHYPTDTEAGRLLAKDVVDKLLETPAMQDAIKTIREEVKPFLKP